MEKFDKDEFISKAQAYLVIINRYKIVISIVLIAIVYGFVFWRITSLNNAQPSADEISAQTNPLMSAHIDKQTVSQLESLRDNSVNVQSLFDEDRNNPFQ